MNLHEKHRPRDWSAVVGQERALETLETLRTRGGLAGRGYWLTGQSGTGKTTIARLIAAEVAEPWAITDWDTPRQITAADLDAIRDNYIYRPLGRGLAYIVNEAHGLRRDQVERLLGLIENCPPYVTWLFTTTNDGAELFEEQLDAGPFGSRVYPLPLARRGLAPVFAARAREIAQAEGIDGRPEADYLKLAKDCRNNLREMLTRIELGRF